MKKNILLIQSRINDLTIRQEKECILRPIKNKVVFSSKNTFKNDINLSTKDLEKIDGIIIGGSGEFSISKKTEDRDLWLKIKKANPIIKKAIKKNIPVLGICLGHQYLAYLLGSKIIRDKKQKEVGAFKISITPHGKNDPLFKNLPSNFLAQEGHEDCVEKLPKGASLLAVGKKCKIQSFRFKNIYGVQFHPELYKKEDVKFRAKLSPDYINEKDKVNFISCSESVKILRNFLSII